MGKMSKIRQKAAREDVVTRVYYAGYIKDFTNPYPETDRRHEWFKKETSKYHRLDADLKEMYEAYGTPLPKEARKKNPGRVLDEEKLAQLYIKKMEKQRRDDELLDESWDD